MSAPNYLGTATGLTGIPSALPSSFNKIEDPAAKDAIYQLQNWANSFFAWNYGVISGDSYTTGGVVFTYPRPFSSNVLALVATPFNVSAAAQAVVTSSGLGAAAIELNTAAGVELAAGVAYEFSYIAIGH